MTDKNTRSRTGERLPEKIRYFVSGDVQLMRNLSRARHGIINKMSGVEALTEGGAQITCDFMLEVKTIDKVAKIRKAIADIRPDQSVTVWRQMNSFSSITRLSEEKVDQLMSNGAHISNPA